MRRVLVVGDYPPPYGGVSVPVAALGRQLAARSDTEVRVLDIGERRAERRPGCLPTRGYVDFAMTLVRHARRGFTIHLHTNGHNVKSWIAAAVCVAAGTLSRRRTVVSLGSGMMPAFLRQARGAARALARTSLSRAGAIIVTNEPCRAALIEVGAAPNVVRVMPWFYGVADEEVGQVPPAATRFISGHRPVLGVMASRGPEYGLALFIDAAARLRARHPDLGVVLMGPDLMEDGCPRWALPLGPLHRPELLGTLGALEVFVRPTYFDGDAVSVREALALGVRVVASDTDFRPHGARLFPRGDADALAAAIEAALAAPATRVDSTSLPTLLAIYDALPLDSRPPGAQASARSGVEETGVRVA